MDGLTTLEARSREWPQEWLEQGREEGWEQGQLALLSRQVSRRFGASTAEALVAALTGGGDPARLEAVADLILDCETGPELLDRVNGNPVRRGRACPVPSCRKPAGLARTGSPMFDVVPARSGRAR